MVKESLLQELNSHEFFHPVKYVLYYIWLKTTKIVSIQFQEFDHIKYNNEIEWCRVKLFDELNITILCDKQENIIKYY